MRRLLLACLVLPALAAALPGEARAQIESREGIALQNQIAELRAELDQLRAQRGGAGGGSNLGGYQPTPLAPPPAAGGGSGAPSAGGFGPELLDRVQRLEDAVRELRGRIDEVDNARQQQFDQLSKRIDDLAFQLQNGTAGGTAALGTTGKAAEAPAAPAETTAPTSTEAKAVPAAKKTPEMLLAEGNAALARHDYATAEANAKQVLASGKSPRAVDAQFLLAQALAGRKDYSAAAVAYDDAYNRSRTGTHAQDSLLGLANALTAINEKKAACETLAKLRAEFPNPRPDLREPIATARRNAGCR
jgi:TolA-binding protein